MKELTELVLQYKEAYQVLSNLRAEFDFCIDSFLAYSDGIHLESAWFLKNISSFSVVKRETDTLYPYELYSMVEGIRVFCITAELPEGCEL
jgi:hypothetical protein